jgi:hypothetical protein
MTATTPGLAWPNPLLASSLTSVVAKSYTPEVTTYTTSAIHLWVHSASGTQVCLSRHRMDNGTWQLPYITCGLFSSACLV